MNSSVKFACTAVIAGLISMPAYAASAADVVSGKMASQYQLINEKTTGYASCAKSIRVDISSAASEVKLIEIDANSEKEIRSWKSSDLAPVETKNLNDVMSETILNLQDVKTLDHVTTERGSHTVYRGISYNERNDQLLYKKALENSFLSIENQFKCLYGRK